MYQYLALFNGLLLALMLFFNGMVSRFVGPYVSTLLFHGLGLLLILALCALKRNKLPTLAQPLLLLLPGLLAVVPIVLSNICIPKIGITLTTGVSLYAQLVMSSLVDHFGWFGAPVRRFHKDKLPGFSLVTLGTVVMIVL